MSDINKLKYTSRDFNSIKSDLLNAIDSVTTNWTSREESDPGIVLLNLMSYLGDNLSYNLDMQALEMYLPTVTQRKNIKKLLSLMGYKLHWFRSATVNITITNNSTTPIRLNLNITSENATNRLLTVIDTMPYVILPTSGQLDNEIIDINGHDSNTFIAVQGDLTYVDITYDDIENNRFYIPNNNVDEAHLFLYTRLVNSSNSENSIIYRPWELVDDLALITDNKPYFEFDTDEYDRPFIRLVSYWQNYLPDNDNKSLRLYYILSRGANGNIMDNAFYAIQFSPYVLDDSGNVLENVESDYTITNYNNWYAISSNNKPGYNPQTTEEARADFKNYINTYDTLVTISDFEKFIKQTEGFNASLAIDIQRAKDINTDVYNNNLPISTIGIDNNSYGIVNQERNAKRLKKYVCKKGYVPEAITTSNASEDLIEYPYRDIKKSDLDNTYFNNSVISDIILDEDSIDKYALNIYCIYNNYDTDFIGLLNDREWNYPFNPDNSNNVSTSFVSDSDIKFYPYRRYRINDDVINGIDGNSGINTKLLNTKIMNVSINYATCRVFDWRAVGTIYLKKPVIEDEAQVIILNVVRALYNKFTPDYVGFGQKISYIDVIETIQNADSRIRYFEAGRDNKKLVDWSTQSFDVDNYFNAISIMRFNQYSVPNIYVTDTDYTNLIPIFNEDEDGNPLLIVDSSSIIK